MGVIFSNGVYYSGPPGRGIQRIEQNDDGSITITMTDGSQWTSESFEGPRGNGIKSISVSVDGRFVFTLDDDTTFESPPVNALPDVTTDDIGKILQVDDEGKWKVTDYSPLPEFDTEDAGKSLYVDEYGEIAVGHSDTDVWTKYTDQDEGESEGHIKLIYTILPVVTTEDAGKVLMVGDDGEWTTNLIENGSEGRF